MLPLSSFEYNFMVFGGALLVALLVDHCFGEPAARLHPVVWIGNYLNWAAKRLQLSPSSTIRDLKGFWLVAAFWLAGTALISIVVFAVQWAAFQLPWVLSVLTGRRCPPEIIALPIR